MRANRLFELLHVGAIDPFPPERFAKLSRSAQLLVREALLLGPLDRLERDAAPNREYHQIVSILVPHAASVERFAREDQAGRKEAGATGHA